MLYNGDSIQVLEGLEAVRVRPGMYIGNTGSKGLHHLVWEILDNSVDEALAGYCTKIIVTLHKDGSISVEDNGRGIPVDKQSKLKISAERVIFTVLHAGGKFNNNSYKVSGGLHGVGASVVNALSEWLEVYICRDGHIYKDRYENGGHPVVELNDGNLEPSGKTDKCGTKTTFMPDGKIMETTEFKPDVIRKRLKELSYLNKGLELIFVNEQNEDVFSYKEDDGIAGFVRDINKGNTVLHKDVVYLSGNSSNINVEIAFQYTNEYSETILSFCNNINTAEGGTHVSGFKTALTRIINQYAKDLSVLKEKDENFDGHDVRNGIVAIVLIKHPNPQYEGQTKTKLGNTDAKGTVESVMTMELPLFFDKHVEIIKSISENALKTYKTRKAEEKVRSNVFSNTKFATNGKLAACTSKKPEECELFIVEGDSAGGSAKMGRNRNFQAILPLRGKIINAEKKDTHRLLDNDVISTLISVIGCGFGEGYGNDWNIRNLRYHKIILLSDADVDGKHIRTLLLTFFYRYMPELIYNGYIYIGIPPLYKATHKKETVYLYNDNELNQYRIKVGQGIVIQRYKGLGEMHAKLLWETTMDPKTRLLRRVNIEDASSADELTNTLMGSKVPPRREFIYKEASRANVDI